MFTEKDALRKENCASTVEKLLWNINENLSEIRRCLNMAPVRQQMEDMKERKNPFLPEEYEQALEERRKQLIKGEWDVPADKNESSEEEPQKDPAEIASALLGEEALPESQEKPAPAAEGPKCRECGYVGANLADLKKHHREQHPKENKKG